MMRLLGGGVLSLLQQQSRYEGDNFTLSERRKRQFKRHYFINRYKKLSNFSTKSQEKSTVALEWVKNAVVSTEALLQWNSQNMRHLYNYHKFSLHTLFS